MNPRSTQKAHACLRITKHRALCPNRQRWKQSLPRSRETRGAGAHERGVKRGTGWNQRLPPT